MDFDIKSCNKNHARVSLFWFVGVTVKQYLDNISCDSVIRELAEEMGRVNRQLITSIGSIDGAKSPLLCPKCDCVILVITHNIWDIWDQNWLQQQAT